MRGAPAVMEGDTGLDQGGHGDSETWALLCLV